MSRRRYLAVLVGALVASFATGCGGGGGSGPEPYFGGSPVDVEQLETALGTAAEALADTAADTGGVTNAEVDCWAEADPAVDDTQNLTGMALCGPVLFPQSDPDEFWVVYDLAFETVADEGELTARPGKPILTTGDQTVAPHNVAVYIGRDGAELPDESGLEVPPAPPAPEDLVEIPVDPDTLDLAAPDEGTLQGLGATFDIDGIGTADTATDDDGAIYGPPEGGELFAVSLTVGGDSGYLREARIEAGDRTVWTGGESEGSETFVFAVSDDDPVTLVVESNKGRYVDPTTDPVVQHYDLRDGEVTDPIEVMYRNRAAEPIKTIDIPCNWTDHEVRLGYDDEPCTERFEAEAYLTYSYPLGYDAEIDTDFLVPERDQAVLVVISDQSDVWLVGADGQRIEPRNPNTDGSDKEEWVFVVPVSQTEFRIGTNSTSKRDPECCSPEKGIDHETVISIPT